VLVNADTGRVDHDDVAIAGLGDFLQEPIPDARLAPADKPVVAGRRGAVTLWHFCPGRTRPEAPKDAVQYSAVINAGHTTGLVRKQGLDDRPFVIRQLVPPPRHQSPPCLKESLNHDAGRRGSPFMSLRPRSRHLSPLHEKVKNIQAEVLSEIMKIQCVADLVTPVGQSSGSERNGRWRENWRSFCRHAVSRYIAQTGAEPWDFQGRVSAVEPVFL